MSENLSRQELRRQKELKEINQTEEKNNINQHDSKQKIPGVHAEENPPVAQFCSECGSKNIKPQNFVKTVDKNLV
ncbi:MAG: hypothetical protein APG12_01539 [Candidatus Methanofastidiosum methylothiophilum]|jgi:hypothetical protein|uniref:Uncharacterized protein n=1 Tax=Candidatus Methanofastidiosum methylothiophilum TaxID=1705564 RepID=A0A150IJ45_9EURY|nr:MAG: hypothetical protein APG10_01385 [Candidatus Methanofastidiosum methylthiophilus]KYC49343.1 MAG: hypothetical protein APG12_01539 [Candidatus Methanofastidiosum methylthiophilus]